MNAILSDDVTDLAAEAKALAVDRVKIFYGMWPATHQELPAYPVTRLGVCFHEAGHVVASRAVGLSIESAVVAVDSETGRVSGNVQRRCSDAYDRTAPAVACPPGLLRLAGVRMAATYLAGYQAELLYHHIELPGCLMLDEADIQMASRALRVTYRTVSGLLYVQRLARVILRTLWGRVEAVAYELDAKGTLNNADLDRLLDDLEPFPAEIFYVPPRDDL